jgi:hemoglobin
MRWKRWLVLGIVSLVSLTGCATPREPMVSMEKSLYERLGGKPAITAVVDDFVLRVVKDNRINRFFAHTEPGPFKARLIDQLCEASGGPCKYTGRDMNTTHQGMSITNADYDAMVEDLVITLDKFKFWIPETEKNELLAVLGPMRKDIVTK